jgi:plasmid stabilization system protein ParE
MLVRFRDEADAEAQAIHAALSADSMRKAEGFETELRHVIDTIQRFPRSGHPVIRGTRRKLLRGFSYSVVYKILPDYIEIIALPHFKQEWGYWLNRLEET